VKNRLWLMIVSGGLMGLAGTAPAALAQDNGDEQAAWEALGIQNYHLVVQDASLWRMYTLELWVTESGTQQLNASCERSLILPTCGLDTINVRGYLIDGLFQRAQDAGSRLANIEFDPLYHYPSHILLDNPQALDDESWLRVLLFEPLAAPEETTGDLGATQVANSTPDGPAIVPADSSTSYSEPVGLNAEVVEDDLEAEIDRGEALWNALGVDSYALWLTESGVWNAIHLAITVLDGKVVSLSAQCERGWMGGPCELWSIDTTNYTMPGLFTRARQAAQVDWDSRDVLALDTAAGVPTMIFYDEELTANEEWRLVVTSLTLLEPSPTHSQ
jgi:hypothetical protein